MLYWFSACCHAQLCPTLCDPMDCSPLGSSVHGILQARILEWVPLLYMYMFVCVCVCVILFIY